jgi:hypothetical protein
MSTNFASSSSSPYRQFKSTSSRSSADGTGDMVDAILGEFDSTRSQAKDCFTEVRYSRDYVSIRTLRSLPSVSSESAPSMIGLPVELFQTIAEEVQNNHPRDFLALARVSRATQLETERLIWHDVAVHSADAIVRLCSSICASPRLGQHIVSLSMDHTPLDRNLHTFWSLVVQALLLTPRLQRLRILLWGGIANKEHVYSFPYDPLMGAFTFKLLSFEAAFTVDDKFLSFLEPQTDLRILKMRRGTDQYGASVPNTPIPSHFFPALTVLDAGALYGSSRIPRWILSGRQVSHLSSPNTVPIQALIGSASAAYITGLRIDCIVYHRMYSVSGGFPGLQLLSGVRFISAEVRCPTLVISNLKYSLIQNVFLWEISLFLRSLKKFPTFTLSVVWKWCSIWKISPHYPTT